MRRVLVTGASGFLGRRVARLLAAREFEVVAVHFSGSPPFSCDGLSWLRADLLDRASIGRVVREAMCDGLVHLAWYGEHGAFWRSEQNLAWTGASLELIRAFREAGGRRVTVAGTCAEYDLSGVEPLDEARSPTRPATLYGTCKNALRQILEVYAKETGLPYAWARIFFVFGADEHPARFVASVAAAVRQGAIAPMSHGEQLRDYLHVDDAADAIAALYASEVTGPVNVASGVGVTLGAVADELVRLGGKGGVARGAILPEVGEPARIVADVRRLRDELGFRPRLSLSDGLSEVLRQIG